MNSVQEHMDLDLIFAAGEVARSYGYGRSANPNHCKTREWLAWDAGWRRESCDPEWRDSLPTSVVPYLSVIDKD